MKRNVSKHRSNPTTNSNRRYKQKIYSLCQRVRKGDKEAEFELSIELNKSTNARWAVKHWLKIDKRRKGLQLGKRVKSLKRKHSNTPIYGNAFKPYQGGAFGLGKRS